MSNPTNAMNLYVRYGANAAIAIRTTPAMGSLIDAPSAARDSAVGSRLMRPVMSWRQKNTSMMNIAIPNTKL